MKTPSRVGLLHLGLAIFCIVLLGQMARVQLVQGRRWSASAVHQQSTSSTIPAPRGEILDARGQTLAQSRETVKLDVAPLEVRDLRKLRTALQRAKIPPEWIVRATDPRRKWVSLPGRYLALDVAPVVAMRGVYATPIIERSYNFSEGTRQIIGRVDADGKAVDGIELALDSLLSGIPGTATVMKDAHGRRFESPSSPDRRRPAPRARWSRRRVAGGRGRAPPGCSRCCRCSTALSGGRHARRCRPVACPSENRAGRLRCRPPPARR